MSYTPHPPTFLPTIYGSSCKNVGLGVGKRLPTVTDITDTCGSGRSAPCGDFSLDPLTDALYAIAETAVEMAMQRVAR